MDELLLSPSCFFLEHLYSLASGLTSPLPGRVTFYPRLIITYLRPRPPHHYRLLTIDRLIDLLCLYLYFLLSTI